MEFGLIDTINQCLADYANVINSNSSASASGSADVPMEGESSIPMIDTGGPSG